MVVIILAGDELGTGTLVSGDIDRGDFSRAIVIHPARSF